MSNMDITKTDENHYHVEVKDRIEEDVNDIQLRGMIEGRTVGITCQEVIRRLDQQAIGCRITVAYN